MSNINENINNEVNDVKNDLIIIDFKLCIVKSFICYIYIIRVYSY